MKREFYQSNDIAPDDQRAISQTAVRLLQFFEQLTRNRSQKYQFWVTSSEQVPSIAA